MKESPLTWGIAAVITPSSAPEQSTRRERLPKRTRLAVVTFDRVGEATEVKSVVVDFWQS